MKFFYWIKIFYFQFLFKIETINKENGLPSRDNFPKGLRGGGPCFDW
jgi:hypothetical protein